MGTLALMLATSLEWRLAAATHLSRSTSVTIVVATVVTGLIGYIVMLLGRGLSDPTSAPARFAPVIVSAGLCVWNLYAAYDLVAAPGDQPVRLDRIAFDFIVAIYFGMCAIPGAGAAVKSAINRFCAADRQPAPFTPASRWRGVLRLSLILFAVVAFIVLWPQVGFGFAVLAAWTGLTLGLIFAERFVNMRSNSAAR